jgi:hypothetical protein
MPGGRQPGAPWQCLLSLLAILLGPHLAPLAAPDTLSAQRFSRHISGPPTACATARPARRDTQFSGRPSFGNTYSAVNAITGHINSFGAQQPVPKKRAERIVKASRLRGASSECLVKSPQPVFGLWLACSLAA